MTSLSLSARATDTAELPSQLDWDKELKGAAALLKSGLAPIALKSPEAVLFVILTGRDMGLSPVQSLRAIHVIQGKVEVAADMQLSLFHKRGGRSHFTLLTDTKAELELHASWLTKPHTVVFTMEDAKRAGLVDGNWKKHPKPMLRSRAITTGLKDIGFDACACVYAPGEISDAPAEAVNLVTGETAPTAPDGSAVEATAVEEATHEEMAELYTAARTIGITKLPAFQAFVVEALGESFIGTGDDVQTLLKIIAARREQNAEDGAA